MSPHTDETNWHNEHRNRQVNRNEIAPVALILIAFLGALIACGAYSLIMAILFGGGS